MAYSKQVPAAERTLRLLETLAAAPEGLTAGELLEQLEVSRSSLFALLNTLKARRYVEQQDSRGRYRLGAALWALLPGRRQGLGALVEAFQSDVEIGMMPETVALAWLDGKETVIVAQVQSQQPVRVVFQPGERHPADASAAGLVLLAALPQETVAKHFPQRAAQLMPVLQEVRQEGTARSGDEETIQLACPVCADGTRPVAALLVSVPAFRHDGQTAVPHLKLLRETAARLSYRLGAPVYQPYGWATGEPIGPTTPMTTAEVQEFLQGPWGARLACVRQDGTPHVVPLWYEWDGENVWVAASPGANWKTYVQESAQVSLTVDEPWSPLRRALIVGRAEPAASEEIHGGLAGLRRRLAARYLGKGGEDQVACAQTEGWQAFRIVPQKISGYRGLGY